MNSQQRLAFVLAVAHFLILSFIAIVRLYFFVIGDYKAERRFVLETLWPQAIAGGAWLGSMLLTIDNIVESKRIARWDAITLAVLLPVALLIATIVVMASYQFVVFLLT